MEPCVERTMTGIELDVAIQAPASTDASPHTTRRRPIRTAPDRLTRTGRQMPPGFSVGSSIGEPQ